MLRLAALHLLHLPLHVVAVRKQSNSSAEETGVHIEGFLNNEWLQDNQGKRAVLCGIQPWLYVK
jgi:hypothetical protein